MTVYYVLGIAFVVWALLLTAVGLTREGFPPAVSLGRVIIGVSALLIVGTLAALLATTHKEHPREDAKAKAAAKTAPAAATTPATAPGGAAGKAVTVTEKEYSIGLSGGQAIAAGKVTFAVANTGKIQHDLAVEGAGISKEAKTPLIDPGKKATLSVKLKPGRYKLYCTVPGHQQLGMKTNVTVGKA